MAIKLDREGHDVTVVDKSPYSFERLGTKFGGKMVRGLGIDIDVLRKAGMDDADAFVSLTSGDNTNAMSAQMAKFKFKVGRVVARIYDPVRAHAYRQLGVDTICTTNVGIEMFRDYLMHGDVDQFAQSLRVYGEPEPLAE